MDLRKTDNKPAKINTSIEKTNAHPPVSPRQPSPGNNQPQYYDAEYTPVPPEQTYAPPMQQQQAQPNCQYAPGPYGQPQININVNNSSVNTANANANAYAGQMFSEKSRWLAFFLCLFLGGLGIHRFYLGKPLTGIIWFFTGGLFIIGWVYDGVNLFLNNVKDGRGYPLR